jgi:coenzyme F420 hydrogenase subunit beta
MPKSDITFVTDNNLCFSCGACNICPVNAISFVHTNSGRLHPYINYDICLPNCSLCYKVCPGLDAEDKLLRDLEFDPFEGRYINAYLGRTTNENIYKNAQSGGMVTEVLSFLFDNQLINYAFVTQMDFSTQPKPTVFCAKSIDELYSSQKSLYVPIDLLSGLKKLKQIEGNIAIVGLPCHIQGILLLSQKLSAKSYSKIKYRLGLICDGMLSNIAIDYFLQHRKTNEDCRVFFKNKESPNYVQANVTIESKTGGKVVVDRMERFILKELITPPRCNLCFDKMNIFADIVFGDPWGIEGYDKIHGDSIVITRNEGGQQIMDAVIQRGRASLRKIDYQKILIGQDIEGRRKRTLEAYYTYSELGFATPPYFKKIVNNGKIAANNAIKTRIVEFLALEKKTKEDILFAIKKRIKSIKRKDRAKRILKKILPMSLGKWEKR